MVAANKYDSSLSLKYTICISKIYYFIHCVSLLQDDSMDLKLMDNPVVSVRRDPQVEDVLINNIKQEHHEQVL